MSGAQHFTFIMTALLGIGGSIVGGLIARLFSKPELGFDVSPGGFHSVDYRRDHSALYLGKIRNVMYSCVGISGARSAPVRLKRSALLLILLTGSSALLWAGCLSDCKDAYELAAAQCKLQYDGPDDADDLERCMKSAKDAYESCIEDCRD